MKNKKKREEPTPDNPMDEDLEILEERRLRDLKERDEFSERLKSKDKLNTKKVNEPKLNKKAEEEAEKRRRISERQNREDLELLKILSRATYLEQREKQKLLELKAAIIDEEYLFHMFDNSIEQMYRFIVDAFGRFKRTTEFERLTQLGILQ